MPFYRMFFPSEFWRNLLAFLLCGCYQRRKRRKCSSVPAADMRLPSPRNTRRRVLGSNINRTIYNDKTERICFSSGAKVNSTKHERLRTSHGNSSPKDWELFRLQKFCEISKDGGIQWLDTSLRKMIQIIENAIQKDSLQPINDDVTYTSSAVDIMTLFYQLKDAAYEHINSDNIRDTYICVAKLIDDFCKCAMFYVDEMLKKMRNLEEVSHINRPFKVTPELCFGINSTEYVHQSVTNFVDKMHLDDISKSLQASHSVAFVEQWHNNLRNLVQNAEDSLKQKIFQQLEFFVEQMEPTIKKLLLEDITNYKVQKHHDRLLEYLSKNVLVMHVWLKSQHFEYVLLCIWNCTTTTAHCFLNDGRKSLRPLFYKKMGFVLQGLHSYLKELDGKKNITFTDVHDILAPQSVVGSGEHIHQYHLERLDQQHSLTSVGVISVKICFLNQTLKIEILNARDIILPRKKVNSSCNPYIKMSLLPKEKFKNVKKQKTKVHRNTFYPIFDESFCINLTSEQQSINNGLIRFTLKSNSILKLNGDFIGETYFPLSSIQYIENENTFGDIEQRLMKLTRPISTGCYSFQTLRESKSEKVKKFMKKEMLKLRC